MIIGGGRKLGDRVFPLALLLGSLGMWALLQMLIIVGPLALAPMKTSGMAEQVSILPASAFLGQDKEYWRLVFPPEKRT